MILYKNGYSSLFAKQYSIATLILGVVFTFIAIPFGIIILVVAWVLILNSKTIIQVEKINDSLQIEQYRYFQSQTTIFSTNAQYKLIEQPSSKGGKRYIIEIKEGDKYIKIESQLGLSDYRLELLYYDIKHR